MVSLVLLLIAQTLPDFQVNNEDYVSKAIQWLPATAFCDSGGITIWYDLRMPSNGMKVFGTRLDASGDTLDTNFRIDDDPTMGGCMSYPDIGCDRQGNFSAVWIQYNNVLCRRFQSDGTPLDSSFVVNDASANCSGPAVDIDSDGRTVVSWCDDRTTSYKIYCQIYDEIGNPVGSNCLVSDSAVYAPRCTDVAMTCKKGFIIVWTYNDNIWCQQFDSLGNKIGDNFQVWNDTLGIAQDFPAVASATNNSFMVCWSTDNYGDRDIFFRLFDSLASPLTDVVKVNQSPLTHSWKPSVALFQDSLWFIVWEDSTTDVYLQRVSKTGMLIGSAIHINDAVGLQNNSADVGASDDNIFVTWHRRLTYFVHDVMIQQVSPDGALIGSNRVISDDIGGSPQYTPALAADTTGTFFIVWTDYRAPESPGGPEVFGRLFDKYGNPYAHDFKISSQTTADDATIALNKKRIYVTVWAQTDPYAGNMQIYGQRFELDGGFIDTNYLISQAPGNTGVDWPRIIALSDDRFVVVWYDERSFPAKVRGRILDTLGIPQGDEFTAYIDSIANNHAWSIVDETNDRFILAMTSDKESCGVAIREYDYDAQPVSEPILLYSSCDCGLVSGAKGKNLYMFVLSNVDYGTKIYAQLLNDSLQKVGDYFIVSDDTVANKGYATVVARSNGQFFVIWHDGNGDMYGQFFDSLGNKIEDNFKVDNDTSGSTQWLPACFSQNDLIYCAWSDDRIPAHWFDIFAKVIEWQEPGVQESDNDVSQSAMNIAPNPFRKTLSISIANNYVAKNAKLKIYDICGRLIKQLDVQSAFTISWDGTDKYGIALPSGVYFVALDNETKCLIQKAIKMR